MQRYIIAFTYFTNNSYFYFDGVRVSLVRKLEDEASSPSTKV